MRMALGFTIVCACWLVGPATGPSASLSAIRTRVERLEQAGSPRKLADAYSDLFAGSTPADLQELIEAPNCAVALGAGWEQVRRTLPESEQQEAVAPDADQLHRFLGLVERCTRVSLPLRWTATVRRVTGYSRTQIVFATPGRKGSSETGDYPSDAQEEHPTYQWEQDRWKVTVGGKTWSAYRAVDLRHGVAVASAGETLVLASYQSIPGPYVVCALDRQTGEVGWRNNVWAKGGTGGGTGRGWHDVQLRVREENLVVFGLSENVAYIEGFDAKTGRSLYRFSTSYYTPRPSVRAGGGNEDVTGGPSKNREKNR
jgi:hypothetical protein